MTGNIITHIVKIIPRYKKVCFMLFKELRELNALSVEQTAEMLGVTAKTVYRWEKGEIEPRKAFLRLLEERFNYRKKPHDHNPDFTFIDLFAGIGGIRKGFEAVNGKCVFTSEWDNYAQRTYRANFPDDHEIAGDITKVKAEEIPTHDVLLAGFPCQPFSIAGVSKNNALGRAHGFMNKAQGTLFFDVLRILKYHKPAAFLLENVKNLQSHNKGDTFKTIVGALENELGYNLSWGVVDGKGYVPQHRERIYIVGFREINDFDLKKFKFADPTKGPTLDTILHSPGETPEEHFTLKPLRKTSNIKNIINEKYTLSDKLWKYLQDYAKKHKAKGNGFGFGLNDPTEKARTLSARYYKDGSEILIAQQELKNPRRLTPRECARLMGFDDDRNPQMIIPVSDTRAYQQFGNSVVVPVIKQIAIYMKPYIMKQIKKD